MPKVKWAGNVLSRHPGALHRQLGISQDTKIPKTLLTKIVDTDIGSTIRNPTSAGRRRYKVTRLMKQRATPVLTARGFKHRGRRRDRIVH
jgi:hypothetical protein